MNRCLCCFPVFQLLLFSSRTFANRCSTGVIGVRAQHKPNEVFRAQKWTLWLFGNNLASTKEIRIARHTDCVGHWSRNISRDIFTEISPTTIKVENVILETAGIYNVCLSLGQNRKFCSVDGESNQIHVVNRVPEHKSSKKSKLFMYALYIQIPVILVFITLSGLFSGLNIGLIALDTSELRLIRKTGSDSEKKYATAILPVRKKGNYLLCSILVGNTLVNTVITLLVDNIMESELPDTVDAVYRTIISTIIPTLAIVIFGEIVPQSICTKYGLAVGARTIWLTYAVMGITSPVSFPLSKVLDCVVGKETERQYGPRRLIELVRHRYKKRTTGSMASSSSSTESEVSGESEKQTIKIFKGATRLQDATVGETMTPQAEIFMIEEGTILDRKKIQQILRSGYTRIPIYQFHNPDKVILSLNVKDLAMVDPSGNNTVDRIIKRNPYNPDIRFALENTMNKVLLKDFRKGKYHFVVVNKIEEDAQTGEIRYKIAGLTSLEDVIEEIIGVEIADENDHRKEKLQQRFGETVSENVCSELPLSSGTATIMWEWMTDNLEVFKDKKMPVVSLRKMIHRLKLDTRRADVTCLLNKGEVATALILLLEGRFRLVLGTDEVEMGPLQSFGTRAFQTLSLLVMNSGKPTQSKIERWRESISYVPNYTLVAMEGCVYLKMEVADCIEALEECRKLPSSSTFESSLTHSDTTQRV